MEKVILNGKLIDASKARIPASDSGLLYGAGLFETMMAKDGIVFRLGDHLDRLFASAEALLILNTYEKADIEKSIYKLLDANKLKDARIRLTLTSGSIAVTEDQPVSTMLITATALEAYPDQYYKNGVMVVISQAKQNPTDSLSGHKTINYFSKIIALQQAKDKGAAEALWFTTSNCLAEGCISNVFIVKDGKLFTPPVDTPVLPGIARKTVCEIALENSTELSIELIEKELFIDDLLEADEVFLTNVIMQIMPVIGVEKHTVGDGKVGPVVNRLRELFQQYVQSQCVGAK